MLDVLQKSGKYPCAVCCKGVGNNSIECSQYKLWVHKEHKGESLPIDGRPMTWVDVEDTKIDVEDTFCYLGDMLCSGGDCDSAITTTCHHHHMLCGLEKAQETTACPHLQAPLS